MQVLAAANVAMAANTAVNAVKAGQGSTINGKDNQFLTGAKNQDGTPKTNPDGTPETRDATAAEKVGGINVSISIGSSSSQSNTVQTSDSARGSSLAAGNNVNITATGADSDSDITVQGATLQAGNQVNLNAQDEIKLLATKNTADQHSTNSSKSASVGISIGTSGFGVTLAASQGRGNADGSDVTWSNTQVNAGQQALLNSGSDTTLKGAVVAAPQITANVGGNLKVESLQDTSKFDNKQQSLGGSLTIGAGVSGSISASKSNTNSDYASVTEQSGLKAGDGGFAIKVAGNTDLKAGAITSTQKAIDDANNSFSSAGTLTTSDIQNQANYSASSVGINIGTGFDPSGKLTPQGTSAGIGQDSGDANSTTTAAISGIAGNKEARTGDVQTGTQKIFDADKVQKSIDAQVQITQTFGQQAGAVVEGYAQGQRTSLRERLKNASTAEEKAQIEQAIKDVNTQEHVINVLMGAVTGFGTGALTKESLSAAADQMRQLMIEDSKKFAGVTDGTTVLNNITGPSDGVRGDALKIGGTRVDLDLLCGAANERCVVQKNTDGTPILEMQGKTQLKLNDQGQVVFDPSGAKGLSLQEYLQTPEGQKMVGPTGGIQGAKGTLFGVSYEAGSWQDKLIEAFSGTHDMIGGKLSDLYDGQGNIKRGMTDMERDIYNNAITISAIPLATPFALAEALPPDLWKAISILLGAAK
ncbi:hemagglutinin repeat-containing protein [Rhodoferax antarcticus]|uniref:hemagglutinin repeat-containing protein n=1 Tax=Rhodoferax antarcticus TaxID=81479 RepID=UPI0022249A4B|nr:hemagglutinin repeat-containing protein [Rhodoferax antarcticus]MCW2314461.1 hypothetical protein [Rhodoferax antarcticus]